MQTMRKGRVTGLPTFVFHSTAWRVQVKVFDWSDSPRWSDLPTKFSVSALPQSADKSTAFSRGRHLYHGPDFRSAWDAVRKLAGDHAVPAELSKYAS